MTPLWRVTDNTGKDIRDLIDVESGGRIGIGLTTPLANVHVAGEVRIENGDSMVNQLCPEGAPGSCFNVSDFGGNSPSFACSLANGGDYATGFAGGKISCAPDQEVRCPTGKRLIGINPDGTLVCAGNFDGCPSRNVQLCYNSVTGLFDIHSLPASPQNVYEWTVTSGINYKERWHCGDTSASHPNVWHESVADRTGECSCTPSNTPETIACEGNWNGGVGHWTGTIDRETVVTCTPNTSSTTTITGHTCACDPQTETNAFSCPAGYTGSDTQRRDWICDSAVAGH